jgi:glycosyltransferase involved in cell wall biosynthesis
MNERKRLLFLCQTLPYPLDGGVWIRTYHVLRMLAAHFDVTALCFERMGVSAARDRKDVDASVAALEKFGRIETFPIPQAHSRARRLFDHLRSVGHRRVYTEFLYASQAFRGRLEQLLADDCFDLVHVDSLDLAGYLPLLDAMPVVCVHHNVESELLRRRARFEVRGLASRYYRYQAERMQEQERRWLPRVALNVAVSGPDRDALAQLAPSAPLLVVPNGVDVSEFQPAASSTGEGQGVAFIGGTHWFPNLDALDHFCEDVLPHLRGALSPLPVRWVGSASAEEQKRYRRRYDVELTGYVDDVKPYMQAALCHVVPLRAGGGTRLKILNSWAMGKAVVSTSVGCEGLDARDGENILIRDDPRAFAEAIVALHRDADTRVRLERGARRTAEERYSWSVIGREMLARYRELAGD